jgi:hypothetical protein
LNPGLPTPAYPSASVHLTTCFLVWKLNVKLAARDVCPNQENTVKLQDQKAQVQNDSVECTGLALSVSVEGECGSAALRSLGLTPEATKSHQCFFNGMMESNMCKVWSGLEPRLQKVGEIVAQAERQRLLGMAVYYSSQLWFVWFYDVDNAHSSTGFGILCRTRVLFILMLP